MGECSQETAFEILDTFVAAGGNFIDSANMYQNGESEIWLGECKKYPFWTKVDFTPFHIPRR